MRQFTMITAPDRLMHILRVNGMRWSDMSLIKFNDVKELKTIQKSKKGITN